MWKYPEKDSQIPIQTRIFWINIFVLSLFFLLCLRLMYMQVIKGREYRIRSEHNRIRLREIPAYRGRILDRNGIVLVDNKPSYNLYVIPEEVSNPESLFSRLSHLIDIGNLDEVKKRFFEKKRICPFKPVCIKRNMSFDEVARIETNKLMLPGVIIRVEGKRDYKYGKLASHILGYISWNRKGKVGIEYRWDKYLSGIPGGMQIEVDANGRMVDIISKRPPIPGDDVYLTIDKRLQEKAEEILKGKVGAIVAINPNDGEILAMASSPSFDPNMFVDGMDKETWENIIHSKKHPLQNRAIQGLYPPGSTFKPVVAIAGLEEGVITPNTIFFCSGKFHYGNRVFRCWKEGGHGKVNLHKAIRESCDIYFYNVAKLLGIKKIAYYARMFGLGEKTGIDIGGESKGLVPTPEWKLKRFGIPWQGGETLSLAIGQSYLLVTPIQMAVLYSSIFNGGILYKPFITKCIKAPDGSIVYKARPVIRRKLKIKKAYLQLIKDALIAVVNEPHGTGIRARIKGIKVAGKTGTVQLREDKEGEDDDSKIKEHAWFIGIAPAEKPKICVSVIIEHGGHGGSVAAPIAKELIEEYLKYDR